MQCTALVRCRSSGRINFAAQPKIGVEGRGPLRTAASTSSTTARDAVRHNAKRKGLIDAYSRLRGGHAVFPRGQRRAQLTVHAAIMSPTHNEHSRDHRTFSDCTVVLAEYLRGFSHKRPMRGCKVELAARESGWDSERVLDMLDQRVESLSSILACSRDDMLNTLLDHPFLIAVEESHLMRCLLTLRDLLPDADVSKLIRDRVELLWREDAMDKAAEAVRLLTANNLNPSELVQKQPILLLVHEPLYGDRYGPSRSNLLRTDQMGFHFRRRV